MRDLKIKPGMDTPKAKLKNPAPKDADSILKQHMDERQKEKEPESRDPVRYATDRVEKTMRRGAAGAANASRRMIKHYRGKLRQGKENAIRTHSAAEPTDMGIGSGSSCRKSLFSFISCFAYCFNTGCLIPIILSQPGISEDVNAAYSPLSVIPRSSFLIYSSIIHKEDTCL